jgi:hypothetical protein
MRWAGHVARMGKSRSECENFVAKRDGKDSSRRSSRRWMVILKLAYMNMGCIDAAHWRALRSSIKSEEFFDKMSDY